MNYKFIVKRDGEPNILLSSIKKVKKKINCSPTKDINKILKDSIFWERYINSN